MKKSIFKTMLLAGSLSVLFSFASFAGEWKQDTTGWWWQNDDGSYPTSQWQWIDGNKDGVSECYYFDSNGYMMVNAEVEGSTVNSDGAWTVDGIVQTQGTTQQTANNNTDIKLETNFIKQEYVDLLGKTKEYVAEKLGRIYEEEEPYDLEGKTISLVYFENDNGLFTAEFEDGRLVMLQVMGNVMFNEGMEDELLRTPGFGYEDSTIFSWVLNQSPIVLLSIDTKYMAIPPMRMWLLELVE